MYIKNTGERVWIEKEYGEGVVRVAIPEKPLRLIATKKFNKSIVHPEFACGCRIEPNPIDGNTDYFMYSVYITHKDRLCMP